MLNSNFVHSFVIPLIVMLSVLLFAFAPPAAIVTLFTFESGERSQMLPG